MENFTPTEDQLFDYHLGDLDDRILQQKIAVYLKNNPNVEKEFQDWSLLESTYQKTLVASPSAAALQNVRQTALREMQKTKPGFAGFASPNFLKRLALSFSLVLVAGMTAWFAKNGLSGPEQIDLAHNADAAVHTDHLSAVSGAEAGNTETGLNADEEAWAKQQLDSALTAFQNNDFATANQNFSQIASRYPQFSQNKTLYTYWVESLKQLGQFDQAAEKRTQLEALEKN